MEISEKKRICVTIASLAHVVLQCFVWVVAGEGTWLLSAMKINHTIHNLINNIIISSNHCHCVRIEYNSKD
jgi:hypothetical protein